MNVKTILNYETKNIKLTLFNFKNENNKLTFKLKINDKNKVNIVNKSTNLLVEITQNIKESIMKIGNKKFKFDFSNLDVTLKKFLMQDIEDCLYRCNTELENEKLIKKNME